MWDSCSPMDGSPPGSSVPGVLQARTLEWVAVPFSRGSSWPRDRTCVSCIIRQIVYRRSLEVRILSFLMNDILLTTDGINLPEVKEQKEHSKDRLFHKQHMQVETQGVTGAWHFKRWANYSGIWVREWWRIQWKRRMAFKRQGLQKTHICEQMN